MTDLVPELPQSDEYIYSASEFSYDRLDAETRTLAQSGATEIKTLMKQTAQNNVLIGQKLLSVKEHLGHGLFGKWLKAEFDWSWMTATRFMNVAVKFNNLLNLEAIAPSALYLLAAPSTPDSARAIALERAAQGESISHSVAKKLVCDAKNGAVGKRTPVQPTEPLEPARAFGSAQPLEPLEPPVRLPKEISTCNWNRDRGQDRFLQVNLYDQAAGMKLERLAKEQDKLPQTIVELGLDALEVLPEREKKITELILKLQDSESETTLKDSKLAELEQAMRSKDSRLADLEQTLALRDSRLAELEEAMRKPPQGSAQKPLVISDMNDSRVTELELALEQKDSKLAEVEEQLEASEYYSTQASLKIEALQKELAQANQLIEPQQPKTLPSGKPQPVPRNDANPAPNLKSLIDFFDVAAEKLQKPSVQISRNGKTIVVSRNSTQHPGALNIKAGGAWQGRIEPNGNLYKIWEWDEWVMPMLQEFAANPAEIAAQHGRSSGFCCFCKHALTDERSLATGYGATCAQHYGLQWPLENKLSTQLEPGATLG